MIQSRSVCLVAISLHQVFIVSITLMSELVSLDAVSLLVEFFEVVIHSVLFYRKLYPEGIFTLKRKYGVPVHISLYPDLNHYINKTLLVLKKVLENGELKEVDVCFYDSDSIPIEKIVLKLMEFDKLSDASIVDPYLLNLRECFRTFLLKLSVSTCYVNPLPTGSTFKILLHTTESTAVSVNEDPHIQEFPVVEASPKEYSVLNHEIVPLKYVNHELITLNAYCEQKKYLIDLL